MSPFSIITITKNHKYGLQKTALSIQNQTLKDFEWIIIDGVSNDGTQEDFINYPMAQISSKADKGIEMAKGDYLIFMNAGDIFASDDVLEKILFFSKNQPDFIYGDSLEESNYKRARSHLKINWGMFTHHQAMLYKRKSLGSLRYDLRYKIAADFDLTLKFLKLNQKFSYAAFPICIFEAGGTSQRNAKKGRDEQFESRQKNKSCGNFKNHSIRLIQLVRYKLRKKFPSAYWALFMVKKNNIF